MTMESLERSLAVSLVEERCELHTAISGFWSIDTIVDYFNAVNEASAPLVKARKPIYGLVDFTGFVPQDRATSDAIRAHLELSVKFGLRCIAVVNASRLAVMQYKRVTKGMDVSFFDNKADAIQWIRSHAQAA